jgi:predicted GTPase
MHGASEIIDPRPYAVGSLKELFSIFRHIGRVLPAMGYYPEQIRELEETINRADCDSVVIASPIDLRRLIKIDKPSTYVLYDLVDMERPLLREKIEEFISGMRADAEHSRGG